MSPKRSGPDSGWLPGPGAFSEVLPEFGVLRQQLKAIKAGAWRKQSRDIGSSMLALWNTARGKSVDTELPGAEYSARTEEC
jgi:hypothetical protein